MIPPQKWQWICDIVRHSPRAPAPPTIHPRPENCKAPLDEYGGCPLACVSYSIPPERTATARILSFWNEGRHYNEQENSNPGDRRQSPVAASSRAIAGLAG